MKKDGYYEFSSAHKNLSTDKKILILPMATVLLAQGTVGYADNGTVVPQLPDVESVLRGVSPDKAVVPPATPKVGTTPNEDPIITDNGTKVLVRQFKFTGEAIISKDEIDKLLINFTNKELTISQIQQAANKVAAVLRGRGYVVAQAYLAKQDVVDGVVNIVVVPGRLGDIILKNNSGINDAVIRLQMDALKPGEYITKANLERSLLLINDLAGAKAIFTQKPGKEVGTIDLIAEIVPDKKRANFALSINNVGNAEFGTNQVGLAGGFNNIFGIGDKLSFRSITTGQDLAGIILVYQMPGFTSGSQFIFYTFKLRYTPGEQYTYLNAFGAVNGFHVGWNYYLHRSRDFNLQFQSGLEYKQRQDTINLIHAEGDKTMHNAIVGFVGNNNDSWAGGGNNSFSLLYNKGRLIMDTAYAQYADTKVQSAGDFDRWKYSFSRQQYIANRLSGTISFNGQYTDKNLESSQRLSMGGINGVRAYPQGEVSGDKGWLARAEVKWAMAPIQKGKGEWQLVGFYDAGKAKINAKPWSGLTDNNIFLRGIGIGINWNDPGRRSIKISYARKVGHVPAEFGTSKNGYLWIQTVSYF